MSQAVERRLEGGEWLRDLDPALPDLDRVAEHLRPDRMPHDVVWSPGQSCRLAVRVPASDRFLAVEVTRDGSRQLDYLDDPGLPGLRDAADPDLVARRLRERTGCDVDVRRVEPVRYRPGSRCMLRYDVCGGDLPERLYAKVLCRETFATTSNAARRLAAVSELRDTLPRVVACWPDLGAVVTEGAPGEAVSRVLTARSSTPMDRLHTARSLGDVLSRLHAQREVPAASYTAQDQLARLERGLEAVLLASPALGERIRAAISGLARVVPEGEPVVLCHGGFRAGQVVSTPEGRLVVLDLDGLCHSSPSRDLGNATAHLAWQGTRDGSQRTWLRLAETELVRGYCHRGGKVDPRALCWWRAAALLLIAERRYRRLETSRWPLVPLLVEQAEEALAAISAESGPTPAPLLDTGRIAAALRQRPPSEHAGVDVLSAVPLASAPRRRACTWYLVRPGPDGPETAVIGKAFADSARARTLHSTLTRLSSATSLDGAPRVPEPMALVPDQGLVFYRAKQGVPLDAVGEEPTAIEGVQQAAEWLARLHSLPVHLDRELSLSDELASYRRWGDLIARTYPGLAARAMRLAEAWRPPSPPDSARPIHKDFHAAHVIVGSEMCVVDLDEARQGDPMLDAAHFSAYLGVRRPAGLPEALLVDLFLSAYQEHGGTYADKDAYQSWLAYAWMKIARQWCTGSGPGRLVTPDRRRRGAEQALGRAESCLSE